METKDIKSMTMEELSEEVRALGQPAFRAGQIFSWLHGKKASDFSEMSNLSKELRKQLEEQYVLTRLEILDVQISKVDGTRKYLFSLADGNVIESVFMHYSHGNSVCVSTQAGCRMGCKFCASTIGGLERNLMPSEMLEQIYEIEKHTRERVSNVVLMGSGEPLDNYENVVTFIRLLNHEKGLHISQRNITVSTCGLVPQMRQLAEEKLAITLALSLHASNQKMRETLMPIAKKYQLVQILEACQYYFAQTGRRVTLEYSLIRGENDSLKEAEELAALAKPLSCHINLIPVNPVKERDFRQSDKRNIENFKNKLEKSGINVTIRREMGRDIEGACGQLRRSFLLNSKSPVSER